MASFSDNTTPAVFIDTLLQDSMLFVMDVRHNKALKRDEALYRRGCKLVESMKEQLNRLAVGETFTDHMLYAQCALLDERVLCTASPAENKVWMTAPLQARYLGTLHASEKIPERLRMLLRQPAPDKYLLVLYQRIFAMGFGSTTPEFNQQREQLMESLAALVPDETFPQSAPLLITPRPSDRSGLIHNGKLHLILLAVITVVLWFGLSASLYSSVTASFSG